MRAFILHNIRALVSPTYLSVVVIYLAFAWFLAGPSFDPGAVYSSERLTGSYDMILMSVMLMNFLLFILHHFRREWQPARRDVLASRLTAGELYWGIIVSYLLSFLVGFAVPTYGTALCQQLIFAPGNLRLSVFLLKASSGIAGYTIVWIVIAIWCMTRFRSEFVSLVLVAFAYGASQIVNLYSQGAWFNQYWLVDAAHWESPRDSAQAALAWSGVIALGLLLGRRQSRSILQRDIQEPYRKGMLSRLAEWGGADLSMHHYRMMGLASQKVLGFFSVAGLLLLIPLLRRTDVNLMPLAKVYLGAFVPLVFSFNQYFLVKIDRDAGMTHNNFLRKIPYPRVILNRWLALLLPQLFVQLAFLLIAGVVARPFPLTFVLYVLLLNILCSAANLYFAVAAMANAVANLFLLFVVYLQLRDDVQRVFESSPLLSQLNILGVLTQPEFTPASAIHWVIVTALIVISLVLASYRLSRIGFAEMQG